MFLLKRFILKESFQLIKIKVLVFNIIFYALFIVFSAVYIPIMTAVFVLSSFVVSRRHIMRATRGAISFYGKVIIHIFTFSFVQVKYEDLSGADETGPFIVVCNHRSASDPFLMACLPHEIIQVVNVWPFKLPLLGWSAKKAGYLSVKEMPHEEFLNKTTKLIQDGVTIASFPEGTRARDREMGQFTSSIFRVAIENKCSIVPCCISGNERIPKRGTGILQPGLVRVRRLPSLQWEDYKDCSSFILKNRVRDILKKELARMDKVYE